MNPQNPEQTGEWFYEFDEETGKLYVIASGETARVFRIETENFIAQMGGYKAPEPKVVPIREGVRDTESR